MPALRRRIAEILGIVRQVSQHVSADPSAGYGAAAPELRLVSALAEGADRMVAEEALQLGFQLQVALPYPAPLHAQEFSGPESYADFNRLLRRATAVLVLDGAPRTPEAYEAVGITLLRNCDLLLAVWDGEPPVKQGGTAEITHRAAERQTLTVRVDVRPPHEASLVRLHAGTLVCDSDVTPLAARLEGLLRPPPARPRGGRAPLPDLRETYFREQAVRGRLGRAYGFVTNLLSAPAKAIVTRPGNLWPRLLSGDYEASTGADWNSKWSREPKLPASISAPLTNALLRPYAWADNLANYYARRYRSAFTWTYFLAPVAVLAALMDYFADPHHFGLSVWGAVETAALVSIVGLHLYGRHRLWHERWLDYRSLAERLRHVTFLWPLDRAGAGPPVPAHHVGGDPRSTWVEWSVRAVLREAGLFPGTMDGAHLEACRVLLKKEVFDPVAGQVTYHHDAADRMRAVHRRLHRCAGMLFGVAFLLSLTHFLPPLSALDHKDVLTLLAAFFPALGAAIHGFLGQGDFQNTARRSEGMRADLEDLEFRVKGADTLATLGALAEEIADVMGAELIDWRVGFEGKPPTLPA